MDAQDSGAEILTVQQLWARLWCGEGEEEEKEDEGGRREESN